MSGSEDALLAELRALNATQRELLRLAEAQHALAHSQHQRWEQTATESVGLQKLAIRRQQAITRVAIPALLVCLGLIGWLLWRFFL